MKLYFAIAKGEKNPNEQPQSKKKKTQQTKNPKKLNLNSTIIFPVGRDTCKKATANFIVLISSRLTSF